MKYPELENEAPKLAENEGTQNSKMKAPKTRKYRNAKLENEALKPRNEAS